jgi:uncharacterized protein (TIGR03086 family)
MTRGRAGRPIPMSTRPIDLAPAAAPLAALVRATDDDGLRAPTPCADWSVADLFDHLDVVAVGSVALARRDDDPGPGTGPSDPGRWKAGRREALATRIGAMADAWRDPAAWEGTAGAPGLQLARPTWALIGLTELVVHAWDLARALDRPAPELPDETLRACLDHVTEFVPGAPLPELWGDPVTPGVDAGLLDRIVAVTGRTP